MHRLLFICVFVVSCIGAIAQELVTENVVVITIDGYRWREVFLGADKQILFHDDHVKDKTVRDRFWHKSATKRRELLMPFFWNVIGKEGQLYGNRRYKNKVNCTNGNLYSYAGYSEMFVGFVDKRVKDNTAVVNPNYSVFDFIEKQPGYRNSVAVFSTWGTMSYVLRKDQSRIYINSGTDKAEGEDISEKEKILNHITKDIQNPYGDRYDKFTFEYAYEYLKREQPRVLYIAFDETDEHGHGERYDEYLKSAHRIDSMIGELWNWIQSHPKYKNKTTLLITTDHGRGTNPSGWQRHACLFRGSSHMWLAVMGPDTPPSGEMKNKVRLEQNQVAKTIATFLDVPYYNVRPIGEAIATAFNYPGMEEPDDETLEADVPNE